MNGECQLELGKGFAKKCGKGDEVRKVDDAIIVKVEGGSCCVKGLCKGEKIWKVDGAILIGIGRARSSAHTNGIQFIAVAVAIS